ncbi:MAG: P-loop NTPase fold protein [Chlorobiota bacterium]
MRIDKLNREKYVQTLTSILEQSDEGIVLALNNKWGTGKTHFVRMWEEYIEKNDTKLEAIYFNAWENDYEDNPLIAILGELSILEDGDSKEKYEKMISHGAKLFTNILFPLIKALSGVDLGSFEDLFDKVGDNIGSIVESEVNDYRDRKKTIHDFRRSLEEYINKGTNNKKLIFIVDELDRCRPNYAVSILEQIKHFFSVKNIHFVLSIDKEQLSYAIEGVYGSSKINSEEYLRRFIDLEFSLPSPDKEEYFKHLIQINKIDEFFDSPERKEIKFQNERNTFEEICECIFKNTKVELRKQEKIFKLIKVSLKLTGKNQLINIGALIYLVFLKIYDSKTYNKIKSKELSVDEFRKDFARIMRPNVDDSSQIAIIKLDAVLVKYYSIYINEYDKFKIFQNELKFNGSSYMSLIRGDIDKKRALSRNIIMDSINDFHTFDIIFNKIELLEGLKT